MSNILLVAVRLRSEAAVWRNSGKYVELYDEKTLYRLAMLMQMNLFAGIFQ